MGSGAGKSNSEGQGGEAQPDLSSLGGWSCDSEQEETQLVIFRNVNSSCSKLLNECRHWCPASQIKVIKVSLRASKSALQKFH